jgi:flagellar biosynthetic protein FlhB
MSDTLERTIPATPRRRDEARRQGLMPTPDGPAWAALIATVTLLLPAWGRSTVDAVGNLLQAGLAVNTASDLPIIPTMLPTLLVVLAGMLVGLLVRGLLGGGFWVPGRFQPRLSRIDPFHGLSRMFSVTTMRSLLLGTVTLIIVMTAAWLTMPSLATVPPVGSSGHILDAAALNMLTSMHRWLAGIVVTAALVVTVRWMLERRWFEQRIRMTPAELREERRHSESTARIRWPRPHHR